MNGVAEEAAEFRRDDVFAGAGRFRRFGEAGPLYEVLQVRGDRVTIDLVESGETVDVPLAEVLDSIVAS
jgi:hypothetical protein